MASSFDPIQNVNDAETQGDKSPPWNARWKVLTPHMRGAGGSLGVVHNRLAPGAVGCPFHWHTREDEAFFILSGRGILRYGEQIRELSPGDCISCPAGTKVAHQIANPFDQDLVYLAIGHHDPHEVCGYPDTGKRYFRATKEIGVLEKRAYLENEPNPPKIFELGKRSSQSTD